MGKASRQRMTGLSEQQRENRISKIMAGRCWRDMRLKCLHAGIFSHRDRALVCFRLQGCCKEMRKDVGEEEEKT